MAEQLLSLDPRTLPVFPPCGITYSSNIFMQSCRAYIHVSPRASVKTVRQFSVLWFISSLYFKELLACLLVLVREIGHIQR